MKTKTSLLTATFIMMVLGVLGQDQIYPRERVVGFLPPKLTPGEIRLGKGIIIDDYDYGSASKSPFAESDAINPKVLSSEFFNSTWEYNWSVSDIQLAQKLFVYFNFGLFVSFDAAFHRAKEEHITKKSLSAVMTIESWGPDILDQKINWKTEDTELKRILTLTPEKRAGEFFDLYGTHYISSIKYGATIQILAQYSNSTSTSDESIKAAINAWLGRAGVTAEQRQMLTNTDLSIRARVVCKQITPDAPVILQSFDDINNFLEGLRTKKINLTAGQVGFKIKSYYGTLSKYEDLKKMYNSPYLTSTDLLMQTFPKGTILAFDNTSPMPKGWGICDGIDGRPNLDGRYILGTSDPNLVGSKVGDEGHGHTVTGTTNDATDSGPCASISCHETQGPNKHAHKHSFTGSAGASVVYPPSTRLIYIVKL